MSNLYRGPSYQVAYHLAKRLQRKSCFRNRPIRNKNCLMAVFVKRSKRNEQFPQRTYHRCVLPRFGPFGQAISEQKIFRNRKIRDKNCQWWPCLLMDQEKMSNLYREPSIDASYHVSVQLAKRFQEKNFKNQLIRNKSRKWWPCLLTDRDEMSNLYRGPSIDASYQVSVDLAKWFQRRRFF